MSTSFGKPNRRSAAGDDAPESRSAEALEDAPGRSEEYLDRRPAEQSVSIPLYIGGAIAQIAGLMAVGYQVSDVSWTFTIFTIVMTVIGMAASYTMRRLGVPRRLLKLGAVFLGLIFIYALRNAGLFGMIMPPEVTASQEMLLVSALAFTATFCSFLLVTDESVVFTCVWSIAIIGLTGTVNINRELILCFILFLLAASFLLVHQNGLAGGLDAYGVRRATPPPPTAPGEMDGTGAGAPDGSYAASAGAAPATYAAAPLPYRRRPYARVPVRPRWTLLRAQILMACAAWISALVIGFLVAIPVQMVGRNLSLATIVQRLKVPATAATIGRKLGVKPQLTFSNLVQFTVGLGPVDDDPTEMMTVTSDRAGYWRGRVYDQYTGKSWINSAVAQSHYGFDSSAWHPILPTGRAAGDDDQSVFNLPAQDGPPRKKTERQINHFHVFFSALGGAAPIYHAAEPAQVKGPFAVIYVCPDNTMEIRFTPGVDYEVTSNVSVATPKDLRRSGTDYPRDIRNTYIYSRPDSDILAKLAADAVNGVPDDPYDRAEAIRRYVGQRCTYTLDARAVPSSEDAAEFFLTQSKEGYCDLYATATTLLCRFAGLPARVVTGFGPGNPSPDDAHKYILRGSDQHAWTEVYFNGYGWIPFDATQDTNGTFIPQHTNTPIKKQSLWDHILESGLIPIALTVVGLLGVLYVVLYEGLLRGLMIGGVRGAGGRRRRNLADQVTHLYIRAIRRASRQARVPFTETTTPGEFQRLVGERLGPEVAKALRPLTAAVEAASYGPDYVSDDDVRSVRAALPRLAAALKRAPRYQPPKAAVEEEATPDAVATA